MTSFALHLLRHGAPDRPGLMLGRTDGAPSVAGIAACVARAAGLEAVALMSSDLRRTREAAEAIAGTQSLTLEVDARWRELDFGAWDGLAADDIDPNALARFWADPDMSPPPEGERWSSLVARVSEALQAMPPVATLVVTHGGTIRAALSALCGFGHAQAWAFDLPYAALVTLRVWPGAPRTAQIAGLSA